MTLETLVDGYTYLLSGDGGTGVAVGDVGGLFHRDTRYLSGLEWTVDGTELRLLQSTLRGPAGNREVLAPAESSVNAIPSEAVPKHTPLVVTRETGVYEGKGLSQTVRVQNHTGEARTVPLTVAFDADFADLFEVRGFETGIERAVASTVEADAVRLTYTFTQGEDRTEYTTTLAFDPTPDSVCEDAARFEVTVPPQEATAVTLRVGLNDASPPRDHRATRERPISVPPVSARRDAHERVLRQAAADLAALTTDTQWGPVPLAGSPWFVTPFGRDALITAYQTLPFVPSVATGTLRYLAAHRGETTDAVTEEAPGKIFHEQRHGELARRDLVPHTPYYGTVDATPLWILLLAETCEWAGTLSLAAELAPALVDTLEWVYRATQATADDPFVYYDSSEHGLTHKAWKDTTDSIRAADGTPADRPLAVAEVQGYAAAALADGAALLIRLQERDRLGDATPATPPAAYRERAAAIETAFNEEFWLPERSFYAVAKTGAGDIVDGVTSNVGHCLWTGLLSADRLDPVVETLRGAAMSGGWGLRTMSATDDGYSPVSYHAGGVWPHDTSIAALGLARAGYSEAAEALGRHVLDAAATFRNDRLPELYCGFGRDTTPTPYPAACTPQAWGAGAPFAIIRASLGLQPAADGTPTATHSSELFPDTVVEALVDHATADPHEEPR